MLIHFNFQQTKIRRFNRIPNNNTTLKNYSTFKDNLALFSQHLNIIFYSLNHIVVHFCKYEIVKSFFFFIQKIKLV